MLTIEPEREVETEEEINVRADLYSYCRNDPINQSDPTGLDATSTTGGGWNVTQPNDSGWTAPQSNVLNPDSLSAVNQPEEPNVQVELRGGGHATLTPQQIQAFQAAQNVIDARAAEQAADDAVTAWLSNHPSSSAFDVSPEQRIPQDLQDNVTIAMQNTQEAEDSYTPFKDVDAGFGWAGGDISLGDLGGKGLDAAINAVNLLKTIGPEPGLQSDLTPIAIATGPFTGLLDAGVTAIASEAVTDAAADVAANSAAGNAASLQRLADDLASQRAGIDSEIQQLLQKQVEFQDPALGNSYWEQIDQLTEQADQLDKQISDIQGKINGK